MAKEKNLTTVTSVAAADFARLVTSAGASVKATAANLAKYIIETYNGSTVAGSAQSVKSALDSLNSKLTLSTLATRVVIDANNNQGDSVNIQIYTGTTTRYKINFGRSGSLALQYYDGSSWSTIWTK